MRKILIALAALLLSVTPTAFAGNTHNLVAVTTTATGTTVPTQGACAMATVWSASTSTASVVFEQSADNVTWATMATFTDPSSTATASAYYYNKYSRLRVDTRSAGTLSGDITWVPCTLFPTSITSFNNITFTKPASTATLTLGSGKTIKVDKTLEFDGTDGTKMTFPPTSATIARTDAANTFTGTQTVGNLTDSGLTITRVPYASTAGLLIDNAAFTFTTASGTLASTIFKGGPQSNVAAKATDGAIASAPGTIFITKTSALGSSTLATPTPTTHDGYILRIVSTTAYAHVVSVASGVVNGGSNTTITFTSAAIGDSVTLEAYQGVWYVIGTTGTITIT